MADSTYDGHVAHIENGIWRLGPKHIDPDNRGEAGYGVKLSLVGGPAFGSWDNENSDPLWIARYNRASDESEIRMNLGDNDDDKARLSLGYTSGGTYYPRFCITSLGGFAIALINKTGGASVKGQLVTMDGSGTDMGVVLTGANDDECIGAFLDAGVGDGSYAWIVTGGIVQVLLDDNTGTTRGYWAATGAAGYCDATNDAPVPANHYEEIGHALENVSAGGAGTWQLAKVLLHFN